MTATGGGDCVEKDGSHLYRLPSQMQDYWATNAADEAAWTSWCYDAPRASVEPAMKQIYEETRNGSP